ncbi:hypothetical protein [Chryseobacterium sp. MP_3.2]|uniref:hypothetical protein n=1 Tax=Chryseobacterium sp. MP_3.2 TaxID=3071712 RepID=UPI002E0C7966|nr:putative repeat protein (TIGR01451 family) [Chryseobacterium sp. MP_3.2]
MKNLYQLKNHFSFKTAVIALVLLISSNPLFADGSKDLYPSGTLGYRAHLRSSTAITTNYPFPTTGTHYVYARDNETITLASSAQLAGNASAIQLYSPSGAVVVNDNTAAGLIPNRAAELAGPQISGAASGGTYIPLYYKVPVGGAGIYRVEFLARSTTDSSTTILANAEFTQAATSSVLAWDISVINTGNTSYIKGRVYSNVFNLNTGTTAGEANGFYGLMYVLTKDGYTYRVDNNGNNGLYFTFFVNNNGFLNTSTQLPLYKSLNTSTLTTSNVQNPKNADLGSQITHKIFYTLPASDLPTNSNGAVPGNSTWLKNPTSNPTVSGVSLVGAEGVNGQVSNKGGNINFTASAQGNFLITIKSTANPLAFPTRVISGAAIIGANSVLWDGKDGAGASLPSGTFPAEISVQFQGGEVHFPFIDMEYNKNGFKLELLNKDNLSQVLSNIVYWDDSNVANGTNGTDAPKGRYSDPKNNSHLSPTNSLGINSTINGHIWGQGATGTTGQFGDNKSIDTWAFIKGDVVTITSSINVRIADLEISAVTPNKTIVLPGETISVVVKAKNGGPDSVTGSKFTFTLPLGFDPQSFSFSGNSCGTEATVISYNAATRTYTSLLNLPNGCEITYTFNMIVTNATITGNQNFTATILRPNDVTDPDATNTITNIPPTDAQFECTNNGLGGTCNNIKFAIVSSPPCVNPATTSGLGAATKMGITLLKRAGSENTAIWPMVRKSGHLALESNTNGFVITRVPTTSLSGITGQEGMMVYDTTAKCLKLFSDGAWKCFSQPACP